MFLSRILRIGPGEFLAYAGYIRIHPFPITGSIYDNFTAGSNRDLQFQFIGLVASYWIWSALGYCGGLTFGLSMRYLGIAMGQSVALGVCASFGTIIPAMLTGTHLLSPKGIILLVAVGVAMAGIAIVGYAGSLRSKSMPEEE